MAPPASTCRRRRRRICRRSRSSGSGTAPVCMAKTQNSLSHDPALLNRPTGFILPVRGLVPSVGAGFVVALVRRDLADARPRQDAGVPQHRHRRARQHGRFVLAITPNSQRHARQSKFPDGSSGLGCSTWEFGEHQPWELARFTRWELGASEVGSWELSFFSHAADDRMERRRGRDDRPAQAAGVRGVRHLQDRQDVAKAIKTMVIRGAPAIGVAAAMGIALGMRRSKATGTKQFTTEFQKLCDLMAATRPTAVNLFWAIERMKKAFAEAAQGGCSRRRDQAAARSRGAAHSRRGRRELPGDGRARRRRSCRRRRAS